MTTPPNFLSSAFEQVAQAYELLVNDEARWDRESNFLRHWIDEARENSATPDSPSILDLGCGTGFHARHLAKHLKLKSITGADPAQAMLDVAQAKESGDLVNWVCAPAEFPPPGPFDLILLLGNTLSLIKEIQPVFAALTAVTHPGSLFIFQMLDYEKLRDVSLEPRITEHHNENVAIRKTLAVRPAGQNDNIAADLNLIIHDHAGRELAAEHHFLYEHPELAWLPEAQTLSSDLHHQQSNYACPAITQPPARQKGIDRVYILIRR